MSVNRLAIQWCRQAQRQMGTSSAVCSAVRGEVHPGYQKIKATYEKFQIDDGTPIHLKGGPLDKVLYLTTLGMCVLGVAGCLEYYYSASFPKKA